MQSIHRHGFGQSPQSDAERRISDRLIHAIGKADVDAYLRTRESLEAKHGKGLVERVNRDIVLNNEKYGVSDVAIADHMDRIIARMPPEIQSEAQDKAIDVMFSSLIEHGFRPGIDFDRDPVKGIYFSDAAYRHFASQVPPDVLADIQQKFNLPPVPEPSLYTDPDSKFYPDETGEDGKLNLPLVASMIGNCAAGREPEADSAIATKNVLAMARSRGKDELSMLSLINRAKTDDAALRSLVSEIKVMLQS
ncbi:MAG: hypothetical protein KME13_11455 [Myxacorys californica WJT36-NPBG1]|jgi:hypothetical protein|nr:hypothetical protein [Myxacorys californica WJT36-NPBG1]